MAEDGIKLLSNESLTEIDHWIAKYPAERKKSAVMAALRIAQEQNGGWLTRDLLSAVAERLDMELIAVYEIASFYSMYELAPVGRHKICVCTNISCMLCGADKMVEHLRQRLGIDLDETTEDGRFTLKEVECLGACVNAPMFSIGKSYYENLTPEKIDKIIDGLD